jgi:hypothetical protein
MTPQIVSFLYEKGERKRLKGQYPNPGILALPEQA